MTRPRGSKNKHRRPSLLPDQYSAQQILEFKQGIITLIESEEADNLTEASFKLGISPLRAHQWMRDDPAFKGDVEQSQQIKADRLERALDDSKNVIAMIFRLKGLRPKYRDNWKFEVTSEPLEKLLAELRKVGEKTQKPTEEPKVEETEQAISTQGGI